MGQLRKNQANILAKLGISKLNEMQEEAGLAISSSSNVILLSPTGTGKTLAFLLPIIQQLEADINEVQVLIITPSRELGIQIEQVLREMGTGYKVNVVYGGRHFSKDKIELKQAPSILIGTPGRVADHIRRETFSVKSINTLILDEFDKSLEVGFESEMMEIVTALPNISKRILTSATYGVQVPDFIGLDNPIQIDYSEEVSSSKLTLKSVNSPTKDKLDTLVSLLCHIGNAPGIIFCNYKDTISRLSDYLQSKGIGHGCFYGGMEQKDRERALIKFRNGTNQLIIATDLAARGLDIPELEFIIHYQLPLRAEEFTHRNGRTARMNSAGTAYVIKWQEEYFPEFINGLYEAKLEVKAIPSPSQWATLFISGGRKDKISKGDIAGLFFKQGQLDKNELGVIELLQDCAFVAVPSKKADSLIALTNNMRLKKRKIRVHLV
jgi:superfamily II DNA/RNA helicase